MTAVSKKPGKSTKKTVRPDVDKPGKSAPPSTSKPVIVTNRPILKDPMVVADEPDSQEGTGKEDLSHSTGPKLKPLETPTEPAADTGDDAKKDQPAKSRQPETRPETEEEKPDEGGTPPAKDDVQSQSEINEQTKHDAEVQKLIDSRKYELPINAVEKRKTKRFVVLGVLLAVLLALAWVDVAADAGLVRIDGVKPVTHFFSN